MPQPDQQPSASRLGSSRMSAFAQYSSEPAGGDLAAAAVRPGGAARAATPAADERRLERRRSKLLRQDSEDSREQQATSSSESAANGVFETSQGRPAAEGATSHARRHSQSVDEEAGCLGAAAQHTRAEQPADERVGSASGPLRSAHSPLAVSRFLESTGARTFSAAPGATRERGPAIMAQGSAEGTTSQTCIVFAFGPFFPTL